MPLVYLLNMGKLQYLVDTGKFNTPAYLMYLLNTGKSMPQYLLDPGK